MAIQADLNKIRPDTYLKDGFLNENGDLKEGITGFYSLAIAHQLHDEGVTVEDMKSISEDLTKLADRNFPDGQTGNYLSENTSETLKKISESVKIKKSPVLNALFQSALPWLKDWRNVAALVVHLDTIQEHLALMTR